MNYHRYRWFKQRPLFRLIRDVYEKLIHQILMIDGFNIAYTKHAAFDQLKQNGTWLLKKNIYCFEFILFFVFWLNSLCSLFYIYFLDSLYLFVFYPWIVQYNRILNFPRFEPVPSSYCPLSVKLLYCLCSPFAENGHSSRALSLAF